MESGQATPAGFRGSRLRLEAEERNEGGFRRGEEWPLSLRRIRPPTPVVCLRTRRPLRPARPGLPARTELRSLSRTGKALLDPRPSLVPAQPGKTAEGGLGATLHLGDPGCSIACLDVGLEACEKFRRHACTLAFGKLEGRFEHVFCGRGHDGSVTPSRAIEKGVRAGYSLPADRRSVANAPSASAAGRPREWHSRVCSGQGRTREHRAPNTRHRRSRKYGNMGA
jgi:hypothetical protein